MQQKGPRCASGLGERGTRPGSPAGFPGPSGRGKCPHLLSCSSGLGGPLPPASPVLPWPPFYAPRAHVAQGGGGGLEVKEAGILDGIKERAYLLLS